MWCSHGGARPRRRERPPHKPAAVGGRGAIQAVLSAILLPEATASQGGNGGEVTSEPSQGGADELPKGGGGRFEAATPCRAAGTHPSEG